MPRTSPAQIDTGIGEEEPHIHWCWYQEPHTASVVGNELQLKTMETAPHRAGSRTYMLFESQQFQQQGIP